MFYRQFLKITDIFDKTLVEEFDFWLTTLSDREAANITVSSVASRIEIPYSVAEALIKFSCSEGILNKHYMVVCGNEDCGFICGDYSVDEIVGVLNQEEYCSCCDEEFIITDKNILIAYKRIKRPNIPEEKIKEEIFKRLGICDSKDVFGNFKYADLLSNNIKEIYEVFYHPSESAYKKLKSIQEALDNDYGKNTTSKGEVFEKLALTIFENIISFQGTNKLRTYTNQFDCTITCPLTTTYLSIFQKLSPYFVIECKNEKSTPSNTYFHKLSDILSNNEAQVGIVFSRKPPSKEDMQIAYQQYLVNRNLSRQRYLLSISDKDIDIIIDDKVNLLEYLEFKIIELTTNGRNATFDMFRKQIFCGEEVEASE